MTDIEEKLTAILTAEADRHDVPVFSAQRIAENAVRKGFWRQRKVLLIAAIAVAGTAGAGGAVVAAGAGGQARVTVTFQQDTSGGRFQPASVSTAPEVVRDWVLGRIKAGGLSDVDVTVRPDPFAITVTGRAADSERLKMLGMPTDLFFGELGWDTSTTLPPSQCVEKPAVGPAERMCDQSGHPARISGSAADSLRAATAQAVRRGAGPHDWAVVIHLDAASTERYSAFTGDRAAPEERITLQAGPVPLAEPTVDGRVVDGVIETEAAFTEQQAKDLAVDLEAPSPPGFLPSLEATVVPAPSR